MNSNDLGPAMALDSARSQGAKDAVKQVASAARKVAEQIKRDADIVKDPHDKTAVLNAALFWERFAEILQPTPPPKTDSPSDDMVKRPPLEPFDMFNMSGMNPFSLGSLSGNGGSFGGGGASGSW